MAIALCEIINPNGSPFTEEQANNLQEGQEICLPNGSTPTPPSSGNGKLTADQKRLGEQFTSIFENGTISKPFQISCQTNHFLWETNPQR